MGAMNIAASNRQSAQTWPQVNTGPLIAGGVLIGIGALVALAGVAVAGAHLASSTRAWVKELETPPGQLARLKWEQAKTAAGAGAASWRQHPNAKVRLTARSPVSTS